MIDIALIQSCAPNVAHEMVQHIVAVESAGNPLAINVNGVNVSVRPKNPKEAASMVNNIIDTHGSEVSVDMGLMQVNSANLDHIGYTIEEMFYPCTNIAAGALILSRFYQRATEVYGEGQTALLAALSAYNTGNFSGGFKNGYIKKYTKNSKHENVKNQDAYLAKYSSTLVIKNGRAVMEDGNEKTTSIKIQERDAMEKEVIEKGTRSLTISNDLADLDIPGVGVRVDPDVADELGFLLRMLLVRKMLLRPVLIMNGPIKPLNFY